MTGPENIIDSLNDELLASTGPQDEEEKRAEPKRNSKDDIISKIIATADKYQINLDLSNTKLRRMTKTQLNKLLASTIEKGMQSQMAAQVGVDRGASERLIALGALRMVHNLCATATEQGLNSVLPPYGYEVKGFAKTLEEPPVKEAVDACLEEIARESDILGYIESPYARLGIAWGGALMTCLGRHDPRQNNRYYHKRDAAFMGPRQTRQQNPVQPRPVRGSAHGEVLSRQQPPSEDEE